jgi:DNA helicase-2/ATP-dependent DNA helicase PcrA
MTPLISQPMSLILEGLNEKQRDAVLATDGPVLIIAGAGSGKTKALTHRIAYLIQEKNMMPWNILAVTFTNKAANEMKERISKLLGGDINEMPTVGTFHSVCAQILRRHIHLMGYENSFVIYDSNDQVVLMKRLMKERHISEKEINPKAVLGHISQAKNQLMTAEEYQMRAHNYFGQRVGELYGPYQRELAKSQALDFDDLIMLTVQLFQQFPELLDKYQERYRYISVDEYQDTNHAQYTLVHLLAEKYRNICVIGDPDQSIYSWRGANMQNILDFEKDYSEALVIKLEQNYRSTSVILDAAHSVIEKNRNRRDKQLWTEREGGDLINIWNAMNERDEAVKIALAITEHLRGSEAPAYNDFAVLYRTNAQSRAIEEAFMRYGIPYKIVGGVKFYARKEIKDIIAYLRVIVNPDDTVSLLRIINTPARKIGGKTLERVQQFAVQNDISIFRALERANEIPAMGKKAEVLMKFVNLIRRFQGINHEYAAAGVVKHVIEESGYKAMLLADKTPEGEARLQNIMELISVADKYEALEAGLSLATFLEEIALISDLDTMEEGHNAVTMMTLHSAKGLEFPVVFIAGLEEGVFPHSRALYEPMELEEERRLMYVGITRAMNHLYLLYAQQRMLFGEFKQSAPSQFLHDLPEELVQGTGQVKRPHRSFGDRPIPVEDESGFTEPVEDLKDGDRVRHRSFGEGVVLNVKGGVATIAFKDPKVGVKKLATSIAPLEKI